MTIWFVVLAFLLVAVALAHTRNVLRSVRSARRVVRAAPVSFDALAPGPAKLTGFVVVTGDPVESPSGVPCAYVDVVTLVHEERTKEPNVLSKTHQTRTAPALLRDAQGRELLIDFSAASVARGGRLFTRDVKALDAAQERWCPAIPSEATSVAFEETTVERGALVTVVGQLREAGRVVDAATASYRDGAVVPRYEIGGDAGALLLVSHGPARTLWRWAVGPAIFFALLATLGFAYAALLVSIAALTW